MLLHGFSEFCSSKPAFVCIFVCLFFVVFLFQSFLLYTCTLVLIRLITKFFLYFYTICAVVYIALHKSCIKINTSYPIPQ